MRRNRIKIVLSFGFPPVPPVLLVVSFVVRPVCPSLSVQFAVSGQAMLLRASAAANPFGQAAESSEFSHLCPIRQFFISPRLPGLAAQANGEMHPGPCWLPEPCRCLSRHAVSRHAVAWGLLPTFQIRLLPRFSVSYLIGLHQSIIFGS